MLTKKAKIIVTVIFKNKSKNNYKIIVIKQIIDVLKWTRHRDTVTVSVFKNTKQSQWGDFFAVYNFVCRSIFVLGQ